MYPQFNTPSELFDNPAKGILDASERFESEARQFWHDLLAGVGDVPTGVGEMFSRYGSFTPHPFKHSGRRETRRGYELLRGDAKTPQDAAGPLGRLVVAADGALSFYTVGMAQLGLEHLEHDATAQFDSTKLQVIKRALQKAVNGPFLATVERGRVAERLHVHVVCTRDACSVGRCSEVQLEKLPRLAAYICKKPLYTRENAAAYIETVRAQGNPGRRLLRHDLGQSVTVAQVEALLGNPLFRAERVASCDVGTKEAPTAPKIQKHIWYGGTPQPIARDLLEPEPIKLHRTLPNILQRLAERPLPVQPARRQSPPRRHRPIVTEHWGPAPPVVAAYVISALYL